jgi:2-aminoadipate transaminase
LLAQRLAVPADRVVVTTGSQQALALVAHCLGDPGDVAVVEAPSYVGAIQALRAAGLRCVAVPADADGLDTDALAARLRAGLRPRLVYVVTDFQNPSGATLAPARRRHLAELADRHGFVVVEDDPYGELRWSGTTAPPVRAHGEHVVSLGTASKVVAPGLRVGWAAVPPWLAGPVVRAKQAADLHTSTLGQVLVADLLGDDAAHRADVAAVTARYERRMAALVAGLPAVLPVEISMPDGGMFAWPRLCDGGVDAEAFAAVALDHGVAVVPGTAFFVEDGAGGATGAGRDRLRLCPVTLDDAGLAEALDRLAAAGRAVLAGA